MIYDQLKAVVFDFISHFINRIFTSIETNSPWNLLGIYSIFRLCECFILTLRIVYLVENYSLACIFTHIFTKTDHFSITPNQYHHLRYIPKISHLLINQENFFRIYSFLFWTFLVCWLVRGIERLFYL